MALAIIWGLIIFGIVVLEAFGANWGYYPLVLGVVFAFQEGLKRIIKEAVIEAIQETKK